jgi:hypothetical protein
MVNSWVTGFDYRISAIGEFGRSWIFLAQSAQAEDPDAWKIIKNAMKAAGYTLGVPALQPIKTMEGFRQLVEGESENPLVLVEPKRED